MTLSRILTDHAHACGRLCRDVDSDGCCDTCGVSMEECPTCNGIGYHAPTCAEVEPETVECRGCSAAIEPPKSGPVWCADCRAEFLAERRALRASDMTCEVIA